MTDKRIGILTSGGDCPGFNAIIRAVVKASLLEVILGKQFIKESP